MTITHRPDPKECWLSKVMRKDENWCSLCANGLREVSVVRNNENPPLEDLQGINQGSQRLAVKVVCT